MLPFNETWTPFLSFFWKSDQFDSFLPLFLSYFDDALLSALLIETGKISCKVNINKFASRLGTGLNLWTAMDNIIH